MDADWSPTDVQSDPILERMRRLTFDENGVFRFEDHRHANLGNSMGFDTISCLYEEDSRQPDSKFVFKFQNKQRKENRFSSLRLQIPPQTVTYETWNWSIRISLL